MENHLLSFPTFSHQPNSSSFFLFFSWTSLVVIWVSLESWVLLRNQILQFFFQCVCHFIAVDDNDDILIIVPFLLQSWVWLYWRITEMDGDIFSGIGNGTQVDSKVLQTFHKSFVQVQNLLDQNRLLINEINQNHESKIPDNLNRNVGLIRELNNNIRRVVDLYSDLSSSFAKSVEASSEAESAGTLKSDGKASQKRIRYG